MDFRQLSHFVAVAEEGSFTRAARRMHIVQSGISSSIAALERELGVALFERTKHATDLTPAGHALLVEARRALGAVTAGRAAALAAGAGVTGRLTIAVMAIVPRRLQLPRLIRQFHVANPGVALRILEHRDPKLDALRSGDFDLAIGAAHPALDITSVPVMHAPIVLACGSDHPLAGRKSVNAASLADEQFIDFPEPWATRMFADRALGDAGVVRRHQIEVANVPLALQLIAENAGVALLPHSVADFSSGIVYVPLRPPIGVFEVAVSFLGAEPATPQAKAFVALITAGPRDRRASE